MNAQRNNTNTRPKTMFILQVYQLKRKICRLLDGIVVVVVCCLLLSLLVRLLNLFLVAAHLSWLNRKRSVFKNSISVCGLLIHDQYRVNSMRKHLKTHKKNGGSNNNNNNKKIM